MQKRIITGFLGLISGISMMPANVFAFEINDIPEYIPNVQTNFQISKIDPEKSSITINWLGQNYQSDDGAFRYINIWTGEPSDYELSQLKDGNLKEGNLVMKQYLDIDNTKYYRGLEVPIGANTLFALGQDVPLFENFSGKMVYSIYLGDEYVVGRIDYSRCLNASTFEMGMECVAEVRDDGSIQYHPYFSGLRWYIPADEDVALSDVTYRWRAERIKSDELDLVIASEEEQKEDITESEGENEVIENTIPNEGDDQGDIIVDNNNNGDNPSDIVDTNEPNGGNYNIAVPGVGDVGNSNNDNNIISSVWGRNTTQVAKSGDVKEETSGFESNSTGVKEVTTDNNDTIEVPTLGEVEDSQDICANTWQRTIMGLLLLMTAGVGLILWWLLFIKKQKGDKKGTTE